MQATSLWSQLEIARTMWMDKCKAQGLLDRKSLQDILTWCEDKNNQVIDTNNQTRRQRWSETDNATWRKQMVAGLAPSVSQSNRQFAMTIVQKSAFVWTTFNIGELCQGRRQVGSHCIHAMFVSTAVQAELLGAAQPELLPLPSFVCHVWWEAAQPELPIKVAQTLFIHVLTQ